MVTQHDENEPETQEREILTWQDFGDSMRNLAQEIANSGWMPDVVVALARGGLLPAGALAYALGIKAMGTMNIEFYTDISETLPDPILIPPLMDLSALRGKRVLIVDDVADSGKTLKLVSDIIQTKGLPSGTHGVDGQYVQVDEVRTACIFVKSRSVIVPDYVCKHTDLWINFPWSDKPPVTADNYVSHVKS